MYDDATTATNVVTANMAASIILSKMDFINVINLVLKMPDYHSMSLVDLKHAAKNHSPKIKQYYIKSRAELIQILSMSEFTQDMIVAKKTLTELRKEAQDKKLPGIWKLRRAELVELLYPSSKQDNKNDDCGEKHDNPQKSESENVGVEVLENPIENWA